MCEQDEALATRAVDARFDRFWPPGQPFPAAAPWLGSVPRGTWLAAYRKARGAGPPGRTSGAGAGGPKSSPGRSPGNSTDFQVQVSPDAFTDLVAGLREPGVEPDAQMLEDLLKGLTKLMGNPDTFAIDVFVSYGSNGPDVRMFNHSMESVVIEHLRSSEPRTDTGGGVDLARR